MTVTYQLTEDEFDYKLFRKIKAQLNGHRNRITIAVENIEADETAAIMANEYLHEKIKNGLKNIETGNVISFTSEKFDKLVKGHTI